MTGARINYNKINAIKAIRSLLDVGLKDAKDLIDKGQNTSEVLVSNVPFDVARDIMDIFESFGCIMTRTDNPAIQYEKFTAYNPSFLPRFLTMKPVNNAQAPF
jgi:hypothetical protein